MVQHSSMILAETIRYAGKTDIGKKRQSNQDHFLAAELCRSLRLCSTSLVLQPNSFLYGSSQSHLFDVADGMGGHQAGNRASELAINYFVGCLLSSDRWTHPAPNNEQRFLDTLKDLLSASHQAILAESTSSESLRGMGTTFTLAYVVWPKMWIVHAGDTRCYLFRDAVLIQLTRDHTLANQMTSQGLLSPELSERSPWSNVLWNALGAGSPDVVADIHEIDLRVDDRILLCSDGLNKHLDDREIQSILSRQETPIATCEILVQAANEHGGSDNITTVVADLSPSTRQELITYRAQRPSSADEIVTQFVDYVPHPDRSTSDQTDSNGSKITSDF